MMTVLESYAIHSPNPEIEEALGYCVVGKGKIFEAKTLEEAKAAASLEFPEVEIKDNCGWILPHETEELRKSKSEGLFELFA